MLLSNSEFGSSDRQMFKTLRAQNLRCHWTTLNRTTIVQLAQIAIRGYLLQCSKGKTYACRLCASKTYDRRSRLQEHIAVDHAEEHCCTSSKQFRVAKALWDEHCSANASAQMFGLDAGVVDRYDFLERSACVVRSMVARCPSFEGMGSNMANLDDITSLAVDDDCVRVVIRSDAASMVIQRRHFASL